MAIQDFTKYLGQKVRFTHNGYFVHGVVSEVLIKQDIQDSEFFVDDSFYRFSAVVFID